MNSFVSKGIYCALIVGGLSLLGMGAANAADAPLTSGSDAIVSGSQVVGDVVAPVIVTGNAISVLGDSSTTSPAAAPAPEPTPAAPTITTTGEDGILGGTQPFGTFELSVAVTGNAIRVIGNSSTSNLEPTPGTVSTGTTGTTTGATSTGTTGTGTTTTGTASTVSTGVGASVAIGSDTERGSLFATETGDSNAVGSPTATLTTTSLAETGFGESSPLGIALLLPVMGMILLMRDRFHSARL